MITVNICFGYSGSYLVHWEDPADGDTGSAWVHSEVVFDIFKRAGDYHEAIQSAWKTRPTKRSRTQKTILLEENPRGELKGLIDKLKERIKDGESDRPAKGII